MKYTKLFYSNLRIVVHFFFQEKRSYICRKDTAKTIFHLENFAFLFLVDLECLWPSAYNLIKKAQVKELW